MASKPRGPTTPTTKKARGGIASTPPSSRTGPSPSSKAKSPAASKDASKRVSNGSSRLSGQSESKLDACSRVETIRRTMGVGYAGLQVSEEDMEETDESDDRAIVWFDIDNTLYHKSTRIADLMGERIHAYFLGLGLPDAEARELHQRYYSEHGLAIRGLLKHHAGIDPLDYDRRVDGSLPLDDLLKPEAELTALIEDLDRTKCRVFGLTNAYKTHGLRCIKLLGLEKLFDGVVYCDYAAGPLFCCKPDDGYFEAAAKIVGLTDSTKFYFVDDSPKNIKASKAMGWKSSVLYKEDDPALPREELANATQATESAMALQRLFAVDSAFDNVRLDMEAISRHVRNLPPPMRLQLLHTILEATFPGDVRAMCRALEKRLRPPQDIMQQLPDRVLTQIMKHLSVTELVQSRLVSKRWLELAADASIWRLHALRLAQFDHEPIKKPGDGEQWQGVAKRLFIRERNWQHGLAQSVQLCPGHSGYVTAMKLRGRSTLVTGSYDGTIRVWDLSDTAKSVCKRTIKAEKIACLDFLEQEGVIAAGLYDTGRSLLFDLNTGVLLQTLAGHNKGIRNVALNERYLVSVGQDKAICVWDYRKGGERVVRFGQQSNVSLGVSLIDSDKLVAVTIDGVIRAFSIRSKQLVGEFHVSKLGRKDADTTALMKEFAGEQGMLTWFAAHRNSITVASKTTVAHLEWPETADAASRHSRVSSSASVGAGSAVRPVPSATPTPPRKRTESGSSSHASSHVTSVTPTRVQPRRSLYGAVDSPSKGPSSSPSPSPLGKASPRSVQPTSSPRTPSRRTASSASSQSLPSSHHGESSLGTSRISPDLSVTPRVVSVIKTPEVATGAIHPLKRRVVCAPRFTSRASAEERRLFTSTVDEQLLPTFTGTSDEEPAQVNGHGKDAASSLPAPAPAFAAIGGAWADHAEQISSPEHNPMAIVIDHESIVVGCSDGLVYRIGFVGSGYQRSTTALATGNSTDSASDVSKAQQSSNRNSNHNDQGGTDTPSVGDATIRELSELRNVEGWKELFVR